MGQQAPRAQPGLQVRKEITVQVVAQPGPPVQQAPLVPPAQAAMWVLQALVCKGLKATRVLQVIPARAAEPQGPQGLRVTRVRRV